MSDLTGKIAQDGGTLPPTQSMEIIAESIWAHEAARGRVHHKAFIPHTHDYEQDFVAVTQESPKVEPDPQDKLVQSVRSTAIAQLITTRALILIGIYYLWSSVV